MELLRCQNMVISNCGHLSSHHGFPPKRTRTTRNAGHLHLQSTHDNPLPDRQTADHVTAGRHHQTSQHCNRRFIAPNSHGNHSGPTYGTSAGDTDTPPSSPTYTDLTKSKVPYYRYKANFRFDSPINLAHADTIANVKNRFFIVAIPMHVKFNPPIGRTFTTAGQTFWTNTTD